MAPHSLDTILQPPHWPAALSQFVTWCLMWDPKNRPTSTQALNHEFFTDAVDPLRPKSSTARLIGRKHSDKSFKSKESADSPTLTSKQSWFRRSLIGGNGRESPAPPPIVEQDTAKPAVVTSGTQTIKAKVANKRATWANGAPMPILPSIRPVSPLSNAVTAQASSKNPQAKENGARQPENGKSSTKKIGRQLSVNSNGNHYADIHRQDAERTLNGGPGGGGGSNNVASPSSGQKESFFAHLRKRARRLSGRNQTSIPNDVEATAGCAPWSNRSSMAVDPGNNNSNSNHNPQLDQKDHLAELDKAVQNAQYSLPSPEIPGKDARQSMPRGVENVHSTANGASGPVASRTRRALQMSSHPVHRYETPEEEEELLHEALHSTTSAACQLGQHQHQHPAAPARADESPHDSRAQPLRKMDLDNLVHHNPYPTPSPSSKCDGVSFASDLGSPSKPVRKPATVEKDSTPRQWPTPPYDDNHWASTATASIFAAGSAYK